MLKPAINLNAASIGRGIPAFFGSSQWGMSFRSGFSCDFSPVIGTVAVDMVDGQEVGDSFPTASADSATIGSESLHLQGDTNRFRLVGAGEANDFRKPVVRLAADRAFAFLPHLFSPSLISFKGTVKAVAAFCAFGFRRLATIYTESFAAVAIDSWHRGISLQGDSEMVVLVW